MKILIVNDNDTNLKILTLILSKDNYDIRTTNTGESAMHKLVADYDLIILDTTLPDKSGYEVCKNIKSKAEYKNTPIILISRDSNTDDIIKGFAAGANDYITLPFRADEVRTRISTQIKLKTLHEKKAETEVKNITNSQMETIFSLAKLAQSKDDDTARHLERIKQYCKILAIELQKPIYKQNITEKFIKDMELASPLHDIGKVGIADSILLKPEKLTQEEFEEMKKHTVIGYNTLNEINDKFGENDFIKTAMEIARSHHERYDGLGYPDGLKKEEIPLSARIMAVADVYDALRSQKEYKDSLSHEKSFEVIKGSRELQFDYIIVKALKKVHHEFDKVWNELQD